MPHLVFPKHRSCRPGVRPVTVPREALLGGAEVGSLLQLLLSCGKHLQNCPLRVSGDFGGCIKAVEESDTEGLNQLGRRLVAVCDDQESVRNPSLFLPALPSLG